MTSYPYHAFENIGSCKRKCQSQPEVVSLCVLLGQQSKENLFTIRKKQKQKQKNPFSGKSDTRECLGKFSAIKTDTLLLFGKGHSIIQFILLFGVHGAVQKLTKLQQ